MAPASAAPADLPVSVALPEPTLDSAVPIQDQVVADPGERPILEAIAVADASMRDQSAAVLAKVDAALPVDAMLDMLLSGPLTDDVLAEAVLLAEGYVVEVALPAIDGISKHAAREGKAVAQVVRA